eukprot:COSAG06_NODE_9526_length_1879_cov_1.769663_2_plen_167_part_00
METADTTTDPAAQTEIRELVRSLYSLYAPVMVQPDHIVDIAVLLEPWSGREQELLERVQAECNLSQWTLESDVWQPLGSPDADLELSTQVKYVAALIRVLHDRLDQKLGPTSHQATPVLKMVVSNSNEAIAQWVWSDLGLPGRHCSISIGHHHTSSSSFVHHHHHT